MAHARVQLIAYEIFTGPTTTAPRRYVGQPVIATDIQERVALMKEAIDVAQASGSLDSRQGTLKLFMAPEFYFRGPNGAYDLSDIVGVGRNNQGLVQQLSELVKGNDWSDWLFVFGTAMGFSRRDSARWYDFFYPNSAWVPGSKAWRDYYREVYNVCIVQMGGRGKAAERARRVVVKEHRSPIDFLRNPAGGISLARAIHLSPGRNASQGREQQERADDGSSIFTLADITFGLEVCLDHAEHRLALSPPASGQAQVQIQLVPSAGMTIVDAAVAVTRNGIVFHCDGLTNGLDKKDNDYGAHSNAFVASASPVRLPADRTRITRFGSQRAHSVAASVRRVFDARAVDARVRLYATQTIPARRIVQ